MFVYSHDCYFATATFPTLGINNNPKKNTETRTGLNLMFVLAEIQNYIRMYHMYINIAGQCAVFD